MLTLRSTLVSLQSLLCSPEPKDPQDAEVAKHYMSDRKGFEETARYWTQVYAQPPGYNGSDDLATKGKASSHAKTNGAAQVDELKVHGLDPAHVAGCVMSLTDVPSD